ncbi:MAG: hypothetical protein FJY92_12700, partial [Candidatus Hydrogenedentes bacterium]|nr:hypothetical protein [Candidatus Hydrogenedentota bacterium]
MINRDDIRDQFSPLLDGELPPEERARVEAALAGDAELLRELDALKRIDDLYRAMPAQAAPAGFEDAVRDRVRQPATVNTIALRRAARHRYWAAGLAAAAVVVIGVGAVLLGTVRFDVPKQLAASKYDSMAERTAGAPAPPAEAARPSAADRTQEQLDALGYADDTASTAAPSDREGPIERFLSSAPSGAAG